MKGSVAFERHFALLDHIDDVPKRCLLICRRKAVPMRKIKPLSCCCYIGGDFPRDGCKLIVPGQAGFVGVAIVASAFEYHGNGVGPCEFDGGGRIGNFGTGQTQAHGQKQDGSDGQDYFSG